MLEVKSSFAVALLLFSQDKKIYEQQAWLAIFRI